MILDLIVIGIFALILIIGVVKGAAKMLIGLAMAFVSFLAGMWLGKWLADVIYQSFFSSAIGKAVADAAGSTGSLVDQLPWWAQKALSLSGTTITDTTAQLTDSVEALVRPIVVGFISILLTLILFLLINFLMHLLLMKPILAVFRLPLIRTVDRVLGGVIGAAEGVLVICMLAYVLKLVLPYIDSNVGFLNESTIYNSFIFYHFYSGNIFTWLTSWMK